MKYYFLILIPLLVLFIVLSLDELQVMFTMITFGAGAVVALVAVNLLFLMLLAFPAILIGRVAGPLVGWGLFAAAVIAMIIGPGLLRRYMTADLSDIRQVVGPVLTTPAQTIELRYPSEFVAHVWRGNRLVPDHNAGAARDSVIVCDALCAGLLQLDDVTWIQIVRADLASYRLRLDPDRSLVVLDEETDGTVADVSITLEDRIFPENQTAALQIWSGLQEMTARKVVDHRDADRAVLERSSYVYSGVEDVVFFFPTLSTSLGSGIAAPWDWLTRRFRSNPEGNPDIATDLAAIGLPLSPQHQAQTAHGVEFSLMKQQVAAIMSQPIVSSPSRIEPFPEAERETINRFLAVVSDAEPDRDTTEFLLSLFMDLRQYDKQQILSIMSGKERGADFVAAAILRNQISNLETRTYGFFRALDDTQSRAVWRILDKDVGLIELFKGATNLQRVLYLRNISHMDIDPTLILDEALSLPIDTERFGGSYDAPIGNNDVIRAALTEAGNLPAEAHAASIRLILGWLDRNVEGAQLQQPNCHFLIRESIKALHKIGGAQETEDFLQRHNVTCPPL